MPSNDNYKGLIMTRGKGQNKRDKETIMSDQLYSDGDSSHSFLNFFRGYAKVTITNQLISQSELEFHGLKLQQRLVHKMSQFNQ